ncbi:hypothetical protein [Microbacterium hydrocarbonoxydans]|uniref:hypothetical protein n=1 Tax=Microbacterium hydrocarbonoxydans TaxID=273678 RepID=UPI0013DA2DA6|nr:hypothetical protein [Microbacterium hydrocarbonoxydans]
MSARGWWRTNALPVGILAVLLPASVLSIGWRDWTIAHSVAFDRTTPIVAEDGGTADLSGATWGPIRAAVIHDTSGMTLPPHTQVIGVAIPVDTDPADPVRCDRPILTEQSTGRQWNEMSVELGFVYSATEHASCDFEATGAYEIIVPFVVPDDVEGPFWVDVVPYNEVGADGSVDSPTDGGTGGTGQDGRFVRFSIDPS